MNIDKMINMLLIKLSKTQSIFFMEKRNYRDSKIYKSFIVKIDNTTQEYRNKKDLLTYLSKRR